jgi:NADPH2:quinone reductase
MQTTAAACVPTRLGDATPACVLTHGVPAALQSLMDAKPVEGQRALVFAASGGVGHVAVQLAKSLGLTTVGVAGPKNTVRGGTEGGPASLAQHTAAVERIPGHSMCSNIHEGCTVMG